MLPISLCIEVSAGEGVVDQAMDYYDKAYEYSSPQPSNLAQTARALTVMTAREY